MFRWYSNIIDGMVIFSEMIKAKELIQKAANEAIGRGIPVVAVEYPLDGCMNAKYDYSDGFEKIVRHVIIDHGLTKVNFIAGIEGNSFSEERHDVYKKSLPIRVYPTPRSVSATVSFAYVFCPQLHSL